MNERELFELRLQALIDCKAGEFRACEAERLLARLLRKIRYMNNGVTGEL